MAAGGRSTSDLPLAGAVTHGDVARDPEITTYNTIVFRGNEFWPQGVYCFKLVHFGGNFHYRLEWKLPSCRTANNIFLHHLEVIIIFNEQKNTYCSFQITVC